MTASVINMDCLLGMQMLGDNCVDAIVTDPPYGLSFMGSKWDYDVPSEAIWCEALRVLKPGGYLLAFAGTRTQHRMACRIEDAGFEIRDMIAWVYGSGFPKHQSALKPALEPITMARKPAKTSTLLNIDACRVGLGEEKPFSYPNGRGGQGWHGIESFATNLDVRVEGNAAGRYPANLIHDGSPEVLALFPDSAGSGGSVPNVKVTGYGATYDYQGGERQKVDCGTGSAARFFYCAKTSKKDRDEGLEDFTQRADTSDGALRDGGRESQPRKNNHPTVKPTDLMRYLCRLVTPAGGLILDPFTGSGSTGKAATLEGFNFVGFELSEEYCAIARARINS